MSLKGRLANAERAAMKRPRRVAPAPRVCMDCGEPAVPLERPLQPYESDLARCADCGWDWLGGIIQAFEEAEIGPSAAAAKYAAEVGLPVRLALDQLLIEREEGREFLPEENMLSMACLFAELGIYCVTDD